MKKTSSVKVSSILSFILVALLVGCKGSDTPVSNKAESRTAAVERGWKRIDAGAAFSFLVPEDMQQQRATGIDSIVGEYRSASIRVTFDYGRYSNPLTNYSSKPGCDDESESVSGKDATIVECRQGKSDSAYKYFAAIHFPDVHKAGEGGENIKLTMEAEFNLESDRETARKILESIEFK
jgi:hypothetical protein